jgi:hypothetical protein
MISEQRTVIILLSITVFLLVCYRAMPYFQTADVIEHGTEMSTIRVNPLSIKDSSSVKYAIRSRIPTSTPTKSDLTGQSLKLNQAHSLHVKMYSDRAFLNEKYFFDASEKVFLVMAFTQLVAGEHDIMIIWKNPNGKSVNTSTHNISLTRQPPKHRVYFWLKLIRNGMFSEMITGDEYKGEVHGRWDAEIYFDGNRIATQYFMVSN